MAIRVSAGERVVNALFLVTEAYGNVNLAIPIIQVWQRDKGVASVIALDSGAMQELQAKGISFKTPDEYYDPRSYQDIDSEAVKLARSWFKPLGQELTYNNILLGEMVEYDFAHLFIDSLRSIEISPKILSIESPERIFLPRRLPLLNPDAVFYETVPKTLHYLARLNNIPVSLIGGSRKVLLADKIKSMKASAEACARNYYQRFYNLCQSISLKFNKEDDGAKRILFSRVAVYRLIEAELERDKALCLNMHPVRVMTRSAKKKARAIRKLWTEFNQSEELKESLTYKGISLLEILKHRFRQFFHSKFPELIGYIEWGNKIIEGIKPDILIVMEDISPVQRVLSKTFKLQGLPVLVIQHGVLSADDIGMTGLLAMPVEADKQAVWGDMCREWGIRRGKTPQSQVVTGNPRFDPIATGYHSERRQICQKLGLDPERGFVVIATDWAQGISAISSPKYGDFLLRKALEALKDFPQEQVVIKLHHGHHQRYRKIASAIAAEVNINVVITKDYLWELLSNCDLLICSSSTVGLEAMILEKPVIAMNFSHNLIGIPMIGVPFIPSGAALGAYKPEDIAPAVASALYDEDVRDRLAEARQKFVYEYAYKKDRQASKRVGQLILQMTENKRELSD